MVLTSGSVLLSPGGWLSWILVGLVAGSLAGRVVEGRGFGCLANVVVGIAGALIGGVLLGSFVQGQVGFLGSIVVAFIGAVTLLAVIRVIVGRRR